MTGYLYVTDFLVPAGTARAAPLVAPVQLEDLSLDRIRIIIPDGHNGLTGVAVTSVGVNVAPYVQGTFLVGNDETIDFDYNGQVGAGQLSLTGFNTDIFDHTFHLRWQLTDIAPAGSPVTIVSAQAAPPAADDSAAILTLSGAAPDITAADLAALTSTGG